MDMDIDPLASAKYSIPVLVLYQTLYSNPIISWTLSFILSTCSVLVTTPYTYQHEVFSVYLFDFLPFSRKIQSTIVLLETYQCTRFI